MREALAGFEAHGQVAPDELPLLRHMIAVALDSAPIDVPFERFSASGFSG
jgi:glycerol-3-phosphate dehydrogenase (NAD(P)+)